MLDPSDYLANVKQVIDSYSNDTQVIIIHLLNIYGKLSTNELEKKSGKAKTTILRHLSNLIEIGIVQEEEIQQGRGRYPTKYFSIKIPDFQIKGQKLREMEEYKPTRTDLEAYFRSFQSRYILAREVLDQAINYMNRMIEEVHKPKYSKDDIDQLTKDNLGEVTFQYIKKSTFWKDRFNREPQRNADQNEYLQMIFTLPIRRVIEQNAKSDWEIEGDLWYYPE